MGEQTLSQSADARGADATADVDHRIGDADTWQHWLAVEGERFNRYERPTTIVSMILVGVEELTRWFGEEIVRDCVEGLLAAVVHGSRDSDLVALTSWAEVGVLMPETDEIEAINVINRIELAFGRWQETWPVARSVVLKGGGVRLASGWASAGGTRSFADAIAKAMERKVAAQRDMESAAGPTPG